MPERRTHDYVRHGTTSLFAALNLKGRQRDRRIARRTSASWLNLVERFFAELTQKKIRRGTYLYRPSIAWAQSRWNDTEPVELGCRQSLSSAGWAWKYV